MPTPIPTILVFDSGVGGISVADEIRREIPACRLFYVADNAIFPYGTQEESVLVARLLELLPHLEQYAHPDLIVIACNTASTVVLEPLRALTRTPIIGVVPAIKPAASLTQTGCIGLLATPGTVKRHYVQRLIDEFAPQCRIIKVGSAELVHQAENKLRGLPVEQHLIAQELAPLLENGPPPDVVVLGCTHFPFLRDEIQRELPVSTFLVDSGNAIARRTRTLLQDLPLGPTTLNDNEFLFTADTAPARQLASLLHLHGFARVRLIANGITEIAQKHSAT
jgi:glutamate racemase